MDAERGKKTQREKLMSSDDHAIIILSFPDFLCDPFASLRLCVRFLGLYFNASNEAALISTDENRFARQLVTFHFAAHRGDGHGQRADPAEKHDDGDQRFAQVAQGRRNAG
jgi:hypothetical protein